MLVGGGGWKWMFIDGRWWWVALGGRRGDWWTVVQGREKVTCNTRRIY